VQLQQPEQNTSTLVNGYLVRVNAQFVSSRQQASGSWFSRGNQIAGIRAQHGGTVRGPEEINTSAFIQTGKDRTQIHFQFGIWVAGFNTLVR
jgi:hypothetical protein